MTESYNSIAQAVHNGFFQQHYGPFTQLNYDVHNIDSFYPYNNGLYALCFVSKENVGVDPNIIDTEFHEIKEDVEDADKRRFLEETNVLCN